MPDTPRKPRSRHSFRECIREIIQRRIAEGRPLHVRKIIDDAGGGSASTVKEEIAEAIKAGAIRAIALTGKSANSPSRRIAALQATINESLERELGLVAENTALKESLQIARTDLEKLLVAHQDSQRMLLQGVDDLRQMVKAGQGTLPAGIVEAERQKHVAPSQSNDAILWKAKHDRLLQRFVELESKYRSLNGRLHELGAE